MSPAKIKVCGITRVGDAEALDGVGVDFLGFNFYPKSKRYLPPEQAAKLVAGLKSAQAVGVFVNEPLDSLLDICSLTGIQWVQLHGSETAGYVEQIPFKVIQAVPAQSGLPQKAIVGKADYVLFDTQSGGEFGGTGKVFDWKMLSDYKEYPYFLAGGLGPHNLLNALEACKPYAVDLNSQVEESPGLKDVSKVNKCLKVIESFHS